MNGDATPTRPAWLTLVGALAVGVGTWLPWIVHAPGREMVIQIYVPGMEWGLAAPDYVVLTVLVVGLAVAAGTRQDHRGGYATAATGGLIAAVTVGYLVATLSGGGATFGAFVPGPGAVLTVIGGLVLVEAGRRHRSALSRDTAEGERAETPG